MRSFEYCGVSTLEDAFSLLAKYEGKAKLFAGGTDLLVEMKEETVSPQYLIDIKSIPGMDSIQYSETEGLRIGALTTIRAIETSLEIRKRHSILAQAAHKIGSVQIRNRATIGGNLCHAVPSADTAPALLCLDATNKIRSAAGERSMSLDTFFKGPGETILESDEILTEILVPLLPPQSAGIYLKLCRVRSMDLAMVGVAVVITADPTGGICKDIRIALGAVAPIPFRAKQAEMIIRGGAIDDNMILEAARKASEEARPISDVRASAEYRKEMVRVLTGRALTQAWELARSS